MDSRSFDLWALFRQMLRSRRFEEAVAELWHRGLISGEMHLGLGEEGVVSGLLAHLREGDAMALDHRGTPPLVVRGLDLVALLREFLGDERGLCRGMGGHMHLFSKDHLVASSGIVGAAGPAAAGFALAARVLRPGSLAVAFFGDGAMNQGMLLESMNLAAVWALPVVFVCKDDGWAITTRSEQVTGGDLLTRARGLGLSTEQVDGAEVEEVYGAAGRACARARAGEGPSFLHTRVGHPEGHFLGESMRRIERSPVAEMMPLAGPLTRATLARGGAPLLQRAAGLLEIMTALGHNRRDREDPGRDPIARTRRDLGGDRERLDALEREVDAEIQQAVVAATAEIRPPQPLGGGR